MLGATGRESTRRHRVIPSPRPTTHAYLRITTSSCLHLGGKVSHRSPSSTGGIHTMSTSLPHQHISPTGIGTKVLRGSCSRACLSPLDEPLDV